MRALHHSAPSARQIHMISLKVEETRPMVLVLEVAIPTTEVEATHDVMADNEHDLQANDSCSVSPEQPDEPSGPSITTPSRKREETAYHDATQ